MHPFCRRDSHARSSLVGHGISSMAKVFTCVFGDTVHVPFADSDGLDAIDASMIG